jgi:hypothetical protein
MTDVWIDAGAAAAAGGWWSRFGDELHRDAFGLEHLLVDLALGGQLAVVHHLTAAATELWTVSAILRRVSASVALGDGSFDPGDAADIARLVAEAGVGLPASLPTTSTSRVFSSAFGDPGGTGDRELRTPYATVGTSPDERSRRLVARAFADTGDARQLRPDEFGLVRLDNGRYVVVLPGVVDLSAFSLGWDPHHRSVRDLDRAAFGSSRSTGSAGNPYARAVWDGLVTAGVPIGSEVMVVGHSYGADTALDLAAERGFNGPDGFRVTHVVAAGYHSVPQLAHVPEGTHVLVLQNRQDVPVIVEAVGEAGVTEAVASSLGALGALASIDPVGALRHHGRSLRHQARALWSAATHVVDRADDALDIAIGAGTGDPHRVRRGATAFVTLEPGVRTPAPGLVVSVFEGGGAGFGHDQSHYVAHLDRIDDPAVIAFLESVDISGYTAHGVAMAIDVSVPD